MSNVAIRRATLSDALQIARLWRELMVYHGSMDPLFALGHGADESFLPFLEQCVCSASEHVVVAELDEEILGYCLAVSRDRPPVFALRKMVTIFDMAVTRKARRRGIGRRLVAEIQAWAAEQGAAGVDLQAATANPGAMAFWKAVGGEVYLATFRLPCGV